MKCSVILFVLNIAATYASEEGMAVINKSPVIEAVEETLSEELADVNNLTPGPPRRKKRRCRGRRCSKRRHRPISNPAPQCEICDGSECCPPKECHRSTYREVTTERCFEDVWFRRKPSGIGWKAVPGPTPSVAAVAAPVFSAEE